MLGKKGVMSFQSALAFFRTTMLFLVGIYSSSLVLSSCLVYFLIILFSCSLLIVVPKTSLTGTTGTHTSIAAMQCSFAVTFWGLGAGKAEEHPALLVALHKGVVLWV